MRQAFHGKAWMLALALALSAARAGMHAQTPAAGPVFRECGTDKGLHPCDWVAFRARFAAAHAAWVEEAPIESSSYNYIAKMVQANGKTVEGSPEAKAELLIAVLQTPTTSISIGPADQCLGQMLIFSHDPSKEGSNGELIWVESFYGQPDRAWTSVVGGLVDQFAERLKKNNR